MQFWQTLKSMCYIGLIYGIVFGTSASVVDRLYHQKDNVALWRQRHEELNEVTNYMYRHFSVNTPAHQYTSRLMKGGFVQKYNKLLYQILNADRVHHVSTQQLELMASQLDLFFNHLPTLAFTSYHVRYMPLNWMPQMEVGVGVYEPGYFYTENNVLYPFSLQMDDALLHGDANIAYTKVIAEVDGRRGRLLQNILTEESTSVIWPRKSYFEIREKHYLAEENTYLFRFKEMTAAEARTLPRVISTHTGETISMQRELPCDTP